MCIRYVGIAQRPLLIHMARRTSVQVNVARSVESHTVYIIRLCISATPFACMGLIS